MYPSSMLHESSICWEMKLQKNCCLYSTISKNITSVLLPQEGDDEQFLLDASPAFGITTNLQKNNSARTNNASEGWHNRFHLLLGKNHPDLYTALSEIQKEQRDTEIAVSELSMGRHVKVAPKKQWSVLQKRIAGIARKYVEYVDAKNELGFLRTMSYYINF